MELDGCQPLVESQLQNMEVEQPCSTSSMHLDQPLKKHADVQTQTVITGEDLLLKEYQQRRTIKTLKQKIKRQNIKIESLAMLIEELKKKSCTTDNLTSVLSSYFEGI